MVEIESGEDQRISIGPLTNKEDIFNQFMEKRDRIFEIKTLTFKTEVTMDMYWLSTNYYVLQDGIRTKIPKLSIQKLQF